MRHPLTFLAVVAALAACDNGVESLKAPAPAVRETGGASPGPALPPRAAQPSIRPAVPAGRPRTVAALGGMQEAAAVSQLHRMPERNAKIFSVSGGDPAVNGLVTYLGLFEGPVEGWRVFPIGDFERWEVTETRPGAVVLTVRESGADGQGGIVTRSRRLIVGFAPVGRAHPATITVTPAR